MANNSHTEETTPERWRVVMELGLHAIGLTAMEQEAFLQKACGEDRSLRSEIEKLIRTYEEDPGFLEEPVLANIEIDLPPTGRRVGSFRLVKPIGVGGMGSVYLATRRVGGGSQSVALKLMHEGVVDDKVVQRFETEQRVLANLSHPNIARLIDAGRDENGLLFIAMEYVDGLPIARYCDQRKLSVRERLILFRQVADAVHFAHQNLVVHRDIKPSNILVTNTGTIKLLDFGIAKILGDVPPGDARVTRTRLVAMTPAYASPEQVRREPVTTSSDVYSLGVLLYELVAGGLPYALDGKSITEITSVVCEYIPPPPSLRVSHFDNDLVPARIAASRDTTVARLQSGLRGELDNIILKAIRKESARRYRSVADFDADLGRYLAGLPVEAQPDTVTYRVRKFVRRNRLSVFATALIGCLLLGFSIITGMQSREVQAQAQVANAERDRAEREADRAEQAVQSLIQLFATANPAVVPGADTLSVREFLQLAEDRVVNELADRPIDQARVRNVIGEVYQSQGNVDRSSKLFAEAFAQMDNSDTADDLVVESAMILKNLAAAYSGLGKLDSTRSILVDAENRLRSTPIDTRSELAHVLVARASALDFGHIDQKLALYEEARALSREADSYDVRFRAQIANSLASQLFDHGRFEQSVPMFAEAMELSRAELGESHPDVLEATFNYAASLQHTGSVEAAEPLWRSVIDTREALFGTKDRALAGAYSFLSANLWLQGKRDQAVEYRERAFSLATELFGRNHPVWAANASSYAVFISQVGRTDEALALVNESLALRQKLHEDESTEVAVTLWARGMIRYHGGDFTNAAADIDKALEIFQFNAPEGPTAYVANAQYWLGRCYIHMERPSDAVDLLTDALRYRHEHQSTNDIAIRNGEVWLGVAASYAGLHERAVELIDPHYQTHMSWPPLGEHARRVISEAFVRSAEAAGRPEVVKEVG